MPKGIYERTKPVWNKGKNGLQVSWNKGLSMSEEFRKKLSDSHKGQRAWNKGKKLTEENKQKISNTIKEKRLGFVKGYKPWNKDMTGEDAFWVWKGGVSFEPYPIGWNKKLKEQIRIRDNHTCQKCRKTQEEFNYKLCIHHKDKNKNNLDYNNLITLCKSCHMKIHRGSK